MYIPKNRIQTNLYTNGNEYVYASTQTFYKGFYWKTFEGKIYTGKSPSDKPTQLLEKPQPLTPNNIPNPITQPLINETLPPGTYLSDPEEDNTQFNIIDEYQSLSQTPPKQKFLPSNYYPTVTEENYNLGVFDRYFTVKINENLYQEINKESYTKLKDKDFDWVWELYIPFTLSWVISGNREEVYKTNKNSVLLTEQRLKRKGLQNFLKENYLKFYK